jgi:hypothetical protein
MQTVVGISKAHGQHNTKTHFPNSAEWFGGFSQEESSFSSDGVDVNSAIKEVEDWSPLKSFHAALQEKKPQWFEESDSGGYKEAWQTYPVLNTKIANDPAHTGEWSDQGNRLQQAYRSWSGQRNPLDLGGSPRPAGWFDNSVDQFDGFGRHMYPGIDSPRNYLYWEEKSVNTSLSCKKPGCTANVSLLAPFDWNKELAKDCKLSVFFHPTDFDDQYSGERVEWVQVNGMEVASNCHPLASGCNQTAQNELHPCVNELPIDKLLPKNGDLKIAAKIPTVVDECPYKGNHLSAVPMVTCLVTPKVVNKPAAKPAKPPPVIVAEGCSVKMPLQCPTRGCASEISLPISPHCYQQSKCTLKVTVQQTDYDNKDGTTELIEYIKVDGAQIASKVKPGKNPCQAAYSGKPLKTPDLTFTVVASHKLKNITGRHVRVEGKISKYVDECASNGHLFDALAEITCTPKGGKAKR